MKDRNVLLTAINAKYIHSNLAVYSLKANAGPYAGRVGIAEYTINHRREEILQGIYDHSPAVVGFSCYIWNIGYVLDVAADLRSILPDTVIVLGGPEVSYDAPDVLERNPFVDAVMVGEGEETFREFLECYFEKGGGMEQFCQIPGLCLRGGKCGKNIARDGEKIAKCGENGAGDVYGTPPRQALPMDKLAFPYTGVQGLENRILYYETMRGCPFSCSYCLSSIEKGVRRRSLPLVFKELQFFLTNRVKQVKFVDRTFNCHHEHAYQIWKYIGEHDNGMTNFHFEIGGDLLQEEDFELFRTFRPGLVQFEIGVQSTNPNTIRAIRRQMDLKKLACNLSKVRENHNIHQHLDLIAGLPHEDFASFRKSFNDVYAMAPDQLQLGFLKILKGSYMEEMAGEYGIKYGNRPPYEVLSTHWMPYDVIRILKRVEEMVEIYYNSFQFQATMVLLELCHSDAFSMFESLGSYYEREGGFGRKHSRMARYEWLWQYSREYFADREEQFRQTLTFDLYLREYVKSPPAFVRMREKDYVQFVRAFLDREASGPDILCEYGGYAAKQLFHMVYVDEFTLDLKELFEEKQVRETTPYSLVFDYKHRNPLNHSAKVTILRH